MRKRHSLAHRIRKGTVVAFIWIFIWEIVCILVGKQILVPSPGAVLSSLVSLCGTGTFWLSMGASMLRILLGYLAALILGCALGIATQLVCALDAVLSPLSKIIKATPVASFIILLFVWISKEKIPAVTSFLMVLPLVWANTAQGLKSTDRGLLEMAQVFALKRAKVIRHIYLPSILPYFMAAATTGMGLAWKAGIAAEVLCSPKFAIGTNLYNAKIYLETASLFAWTAVIVIISILLERLFVFLMQRTAKRYV